ncbi:hypothetical protein Arub01_29990 [Actinomadura rubrobrunea]|uniref:Uncharacterized protein n=1 Tax=Actinomadura rubrobrunea TaxID=115335 RepID=A0A9W6PVR2_9ACTN|nr:hypothetical protein Arub01_29990 [Actinomadura rubrobrunea]
MPQYVISIIRSPDTGTGQPLRHEWRSCRAVTFVIRARNCCFAPVPPPDGVDTAVGDGCVGGVAGSGAERSAPWPQPVAPRVAAANAVTTAVARTVHLPGMTRRMARRRTPARQDRRTRPFGDGAAARPSGRPGRFATVRSGAWLS